MHDSQDLDRTSNGPLEARQFPDVLLARVVTPGPRPLLHGYDVEADLALGYGAAELMFLALTGELAEPSAAAALDVILAFLAPLSVSHAPTHAAVLAQLSGADAGATLSVASIALAEQSRQILDEHEPLLEWLERPSSGMPAQYRTERTDELEAVERFMTALERTRLELPGIGRRTTLMAALLSALFACGIKERRHLQAVLVWARLPVVVSEAFAESAANFKAYPIHLPRYRYEEPTIEGAGR